ncbi:MAG TPA: peptidoglycan-binding domain-containing protein [Candidatus Paceibacterota bacterium]|nr:peptidoglycan-binding domain-containing protein [Candidatus Paceibacterota bacterium]
MNQADTSLPSLSHRQLARLRASALLFAGIFVFAPIFASAASNPNAGAESAVRAAFADEPVMIGVARCESDFREFDSAGDPLDGGSGGMIGIFQISEAVHAEAAKALGMDIDTVAGNIAYAKHLYEEKGTAPWLASAGCWSGSADDASLDSNLAPGAVDASVALLQELLNANGFPVATAGEGSLGHESYFFGALTKAAVERFQCANNIVCAGSPQTTGFGAVGPQTRAALLALAQD